MKTRSVSRSCLSRSILPFCWLQNDYSPVSGSYARAALKTLKTEEAVSRSRFADCPVCKNHTLKLKRTIQVGRCRSCNETYKIIILYVKAGRKQKPVVLKTDAPAQTRQETKPEVAPETSPASWQTPSDSSLLGTPSETYSGLSEALFGESQKDQSSETGTGSGQ